MKKFLLFIIILLLLAVGGGFLLPSKWQVQRFILVNAPPTAIYPFIANFKTGWPKWSDFDYEDPNIQYSYSGPEVGAGATRSWMSKTLGNGIQIMKAADLQTGIEFELEMKRYHVKLDGRMTFERLGKFTKITWTNTGDVGINSVYRYLALGMNRMLGPKFEKSLIALKQQAEVSFTKNSQ